MQKNSPLLSIAMPVHNGGHFVRLAVCSILNQTFTDWELLIVDDGSTDGALNGLGNLADHRIKILGNQNNLGLAIRLNEAIGLAHGVYLARMDHDDICHPERFANQIAFLQKNPHVDLLGAQCVTIDENNQITGSLPLSIEHEKICRRPWSGFYLPHPTWIGKTSWFKKHRYQDPAPYRCEDQELLLRTCQTSRFHTLPEILLAYRIERIIDWKKRAKTRFSLVRMQAAHFWRVRKFGFASLSVATFISRVGADCLKMVAAKKGLRDQTKMSGAISQKDIKTWRTLIASLASTTASTDNKNAPGTE